METDALYNYILKHVDEEPEYLSKLSRKAHVQLLYTRMLSGHLQGRILYMLTKLINPQNVLELGTYAGYSALCMAEALGEKACVDTIEINDELEDFIREALAQVGFGTKVNLHIGDSMDIVPRLNKTYDLVLLDANKRHYCEYYDLVFDKLKSGGVILADNVLWSSKVLQVPEKKDAQTKGIMAFNERVKKDTRVEKVILPIRDGLSIIRKK